MGSRLADIAAQAGVSDATVSRVLNDRPGVAATTRQAVLTAVDVLGFERPSRLRRSSAGLVGLLVPELDNPIFPAFAQAIERALGARGFTPVLCTHTPGGVHEDEYVDQLTGRGVAGIVFVSALHADTSSDPSRYVRLRERGLPIVLVNGFTPGVPAPFVSTDDAAATDLAVAHLASLGHRAIGLAVGPDRFAPVVRKIAGFRAAMADRLGHQQVDHWVARSLFTVEGGQQAAERLLDNGCTAVVCGSDLMALGAVRAVRARGMNVPDDVSVVGHDDSPLIAFTDPPLTTIRQPVTAMAEAAVRCLLEPGPVGEEFLFLPDLVVRGSTGPAPAIADRRLKDRRALPR